MTVDLAWDVIKFLIGVIVGAGSGYLILARDISFVKGQLSHMSKVFDVVEHNQRHLGRIEAGYIKQREDLNRLYERVRDLEDAPPLSQQ